MQPSTFPSNIQHNLRVLWTKVSHFTAGTGSIIDHRQ
jgi:hypothetical protein